MCLRIAVVDHLLKHYSLAVHGVKETVCAFEVHIFVFHPVLQEIYM